MTGNICLLSGIIFSLIATFDLFQFTYHPLMKNLEINLQRKHRHSTRLTEFQQIVSSTESVPEFEERVFAKEHNVYNMIDKARSVKKNKSFVQLFAVRELLLLLTSAALSQTGSYMAYNICSSAFPPEEEIKAHRFFVFGALTAFFTIGIFTDYILKGRYFYNTVIVCIGLEIVFLLFMLLNDDTCSSL